MFRVLITNSTGKNAIALARYLKQDLPDLHLISHCVTRYDIARWYPHFTEHITNVPLETVLAKRNFDMVIPVGRDSVGPVSMICPELAVLPSAESLDACYNKEKTMCLAKRLDVPAPRTQFVQELGELDAGAITFPCVVKASREDASYKTVHYCSSLEEVKQRVEELLAAVAQEGGGALVQEFITGQGCGFFGLTDAGRPLRVFMHQRIREYPVSGGPSTAARAFDSPRLKELGLRLLAELRWTGVAMAEFKYDPRRDDFVLMEINGKFWGSLELALRSG